MYDTRSFVGAPAPVAEVPSFSWTGWLLPFGGFALLVLGIHAGADHLDDHAFSALNWIDGRLDAVLAVIIRTVWGWVGASKESTESVVFWALDAIDLDLKMAASIYIALFVEVFVDLALGVAVFSPKARKGDRRELLDALQGMITDPTILRWVSPVAIGLAATAGVIVMSREIHVETYQLASGLIDERAWCLFFARVGGLVALTLGVFVLGLRELSRAALRAHRIARADLAKDMPRRRRFFRGWVTACVVMPVAFIAAVYATPIASSIRGLLS